MVERRILGELLATGSALASRVRLIPLDMDDSRIAPRLRGIGAVPVVPALYLVSKEGVLRRRYFGWPARNQSAMRIVLERELLALAPREGQPQ